MKKIITLSFFIILAITGINAQITVSGVLDSTVSVIAGAGDAPDFSFGIEEYANLRFQARLREGATVYGAVNLLAAAGISAIGLSAMDLNIGSENFAAAIELERLYFRLRGEHIDFNGGLMRLPFGYGQVWGPSDFLNPRNPIKPDARPRAVLGASLTWYPIDELKMLGFFASPHNAFETEGKGSKFGLSMDRHWDRASVQALYSFEIPNEIPFANNSSKYGIHRAGLSVKADVVVGFVMDALYTYNHEAKTELDGLSFSAGFDYSFLGGDLIVLAEYLYNGEKSSTSIYGGGGFSNNHYLYAGFTYSFSDFTNMSLGLISCFDDISFIPSVSLNHEMFQGVTLTISAQVPLDRDLFNKDGNRGELGPIRPGAAAGSHFNGNARVRIRF